MKNFKARFLLLFLLPMFILTISGCEDVDDDIILDQSDGNEVKFYYGENFVDSLDALYCDSGTFALFGYNEVPMGMDSVGNPVMYEERVIYLTSVEQNRESFDADSVIAIVVDSLNVPKRIITKDIEVIIGNVRDNKFDLMIYDLITGTWTEYENVNYENPFMEETEHSRALSSSGYSEFGVGDLYKSISLIANMTGAFKSIRGGEKVEGIVSGIAPWIPSAELGALLSLSVASNVGIELLILGDYLLGKSFEHYEKKMLEWFGEVRISIEDIKIMSHQNGENSCEVHYKIEGLHKKGQKNSILSLTLNKIRQSIGSTSGIGSDGNASHTYQINRNSIETHFIEPINQEKSFTFEDLSQGRYYVELYLKHSKYDIGYVAFYYFNVFDLFIESYSVAPNPKYENNNVIYDVNVKLNGAPDLIKELEAGGKKCGYFVRYGSTHYYDIDINQHPLEKEFNFTLEVPRDYFLYTDYYSFVSEAKGFTIGTYTIEKNDYITLDEQPLRIVYSEAPEVITGGVVFHDKNYARVKCEYKNCGFWNGVCGVMYGPVDEYNLEVIEIGNCDNLEYTFELTNLDEAKLYEYFAFVKIWNKEYYGEVRKLMASEISGLCPDGNHPHRIDLGLSSGVKWACCNVGASSPEQFGDYYSWGETEVKTDFSLVNYKYFTDRPDRDYVTEHQFTNIGYHIEGTEYDVAHVKWRNGWRMPSYFVEFEELRSQCRVQWVTYNGVEGELFVGPNGNMIFLPAAGRHETGLIPSERYQSTFDPNVCCYWSGTRNSYYWGAAYAYGSTEGVFWDTQGQADGLSVRAVWDDSVSDD